MKFNVGEVVVIKSSNVLKEIEFSEMIDNQEIYYMNDQTSYHSSQIHKYSEDYKRKSFIELITEESNVDKILNSWISDIVKKSSKYF